MIVSAAATAIECRRSIGAASRDDSIHAAWMDRYEAGDVIDLAGQYDPAIALDIVRSDLSRCVGCSSASTAGRVPSGHTLIRIHGD